MTDRDAPDIVVLWDRSHVARKARQCGSCKDDIQPGEKYQSTGMRVDGQFEHFVRHQYGEHYPSGCPKLRARDLAEINAGEDQQP